MSATYRHTVRLGCRACVAVLCLFAPAAALGLEPTLWFTDPEQLVAGGAPVDFGNHAATRFVDWNHDGLLDVLVGGGDGRVWIIVNAGTPTAPSFLAPAWVQSAGGGVRAGSGYTGACFADVTGDGLEDLLVAEGTMNPDMVRLYRNVGSPAAPAFGYYEWLMAPSQPVKLPGDANGRLDVGDFDGDGLADVLAGEFEGYVSFLRNIGSATSPRFDTGTHVQADFVEIHAPYNTHPRVYDVNQDGTADLGCGYNWGNVFAWIAEERQPAHAPRLSRPFYVYDPHGVPLDLRPLNGDDSTPDWGDLDGDGLLDIISGGINGKIWLMYGIPPATRLARIDEIMEQYRDTLAQTLNDDAAIRQELFGLHHSLREFAGEFLRGAPRQVYANWYHDHVLAYPEFFTKHTLETSGYLPWLAAQVQVNLLEMGPATTEHRAWVADTIGLTGRQHDITATLGTLFVDNDRADAAQEDVVYNCLSALPRDAWSASFISIADHLGFYRPAECDLQAKAGVNIFGFNVGAWQENEFPPDIEPGYTDLFLIGLAHEINHLVDQVAGHDAWLSSRRADLLARAGYDDMQYLRSQVGAAFFQQNPQEFVASIANEWFASSWHTFELARSRFDRGWREPMNQFLFFAEIYSISDNYGHTSLYVGDTAGNIQRTREMVLRNYPGRRIDLLYMGSDEIHFTLDDTGNVLAYEILPANRDLDPVPDAEDCAPLDPETWAVPIEVWDLHFYADRVTMSWQRLSAQAGWSVMYDVLRGLPDELPVGAGPGEQCRPTTNDYCYEYDVPAAGSGFWYIVRGRNSCGSGTFGLASSGAERTSAACP
ncbi:MAG: VCBS repeat-containing protein [Acidobacteria bacterium]|nr:VCBS repeat-containing protein [Acidobacteriota bacterium]